MSYRRCSYVAKNGQKGRKSNTLNKELMVGRISTYWNILRLLKLVWKFRGSFCLKISFLIEHQTFCPIYSLTLKYILYYPSQKKLISLKAVSLQSLPILSLEYTIEISPCGYKIY